MPILMDKEILPLFATNGKHRFKKELNSLRLAQFFYQQAILKSPLIRDDQSKNTLMYRS